VKRAGLGIAALGIAISGGLTLLGACAVVGNLTGENQAREIRAIGEPAQAKVLKIWDTGVTVNQNPVVGFLLEVYPVGRPAYQAETKGIISRLDIPQIQPGAMLQVKFDPAAPSRVALDIYEEK
jgi:hypothetical protein